MNAIINAGQNLLIKSPIYALTSGLNWLGLYDVAKTYSNNDTILGGDGIGYKFINATPTAGQPVSNATYWTALSGVSVTGSNAISYLLVEIIQTVRTVVSWLYQFVGANISEIAALTSGTLVIGVKYKIVTYVSADDFANVGAASNASGVVFTATATTPTVWSNASTVQQVILTPGLQYIIFSFSASDSFTNIGAGSNATGVMFTATGDAVPTTWSHGSILQQVSFPTNMLLATGLAQAELKKEDTAGLTGDFDLRFTIARNDTVYVGTLAEADVVLFHNALTVVTADEITDPVAVTSPRSALNPTIICRPVL